MKNARVALITGGKRMGDAIATALASRGCDIVLTWRRSKAEAAAVRSRIALTGGTVHLVQADLQKPSDIRRLTAFCMQKVKRLDVFIHLASIYQLAFDSNEAGWNAHMDIHARSAFLLTKGLAPLLKKAKPGRVIHFSDWTSASNRPRYQDYAFYYTSKLAAKGVVESLALELAPDILVNAVAPGPILPPPGMSKKAYQAAQEATPLKRWGGVDEIVKTVLFLLETQFVTGETIRVDGGRHLY